MEKFKYSLKICAFLTVAFLCIPSNKIALAAEEAVAADAKPADEPPKVNNHHAGRHVSDKDDSNNDDSNNDDSNGDDSNGDDSNGDDSNGDDSNGDDSNGDDAAHSMESSEQNATAPEPEPTAPAPVLVDKTIIRKYEITIHKGETIINGEKYPAFLANKRFIMPTLRANQGDVMEVTVHNGIKTPLALHWHGIEVPKDMDGAETFNGFKDIPIGGTFTYRIPIVDVGTYWYHAHGSTQEQQGVYGPLVFYPAGQSFSENDPNEIVVLFSEHARETPDQIMKYFKEGHKKGLEERLMSYKMLANGKGDKDKLTYKFTPGKKIRLRLINGSAMTRFVYQFDNKMPFTVIAADGHDVKPITVSSLTMMNGSTRDIEITPKSIGQFQLLAKSTDENGTARVAFAAMPGSKAVAEAKPAKNVKFTALNDDDLIAADPALAKFETPSRTVTIRLTGNMMEYQWTINDKEFEKGDPIRLKLGEKIKVNIVNESGMAHPMHLHGMSFQPIGKNGKALSVRNMIFVDADETKSVYLHVTQAGDWPFHCHLLYHQQAGMIARVIVE